MSNITVKEVDFAQHLEVLKNIRTEVFIKEQHVPVELEWDEFDGDATHIQAYYNNIPVGTARLINNELIGRMAVLKTYRGLGVGKKMLEFLMTLAHKKGMNTIQLSAQKHAVEFYKKYGFEICSDEYLDAGIPHYTMRYTKAS